ncbi:MAG TPA: ATP-dependent DNA helicase RecG [Candidatus Paceibacterota bacterium]
MFELDTPLSEIKSAPPKLIKNLQRLGLKTVRDLLWHFPSRYEDFSQIYVIDDLQPGQQATIQGTVESVDTKRSWKKKIFITEAFIADETGTIRAVWFNQPYIKNSLREGSLVNLSGKISIAGDNEFYFSNPAYEAVAKRETETLHTGRLVPIYPETRGLTSKGIRYILTNVLGALKQIPEPLPESVRRDYELPEINEALRAVHFPEEIDLALQAKKRFAFEELFFLQLFNIEEKNKLKKEIAPELKTDFDKLKKWLASLSFVLTAAQKKVTFEIIKDMAKHEPMNRLLQGDVGSGKTVVAVISALIATDNGYQAALMAPTEILAKQHYETFKKLLRPIRQKVTVGLLTGSGAWLFTSDDLESEIKKTELLKAIKNGAVHILIGTHALIEKNVVFKKLGLVIIDEQHRFGVAQRASLLKSFKSGTAPHFLSMSATPIPRTLTLTIFGDLDLSIIDEMPAGRKSIITKIVAPENRTKAYAFVRDQIRKGRQAFVICPRIEITDNQQSTMSNVSSVAAWDEVKTVKEEYEKLSKKIFPDLKIAMLHGKLKPKEKNGTMLDFKNKKYDILVSTSVVEVGVDVPNASIMLIEGADRFGLAQLYQFRGRVGRGVHQSFCLLFTDSSSKSTADRLSALVTAKNGFELAERDLAIRGPGEFLGSSQTGLPDIAMRALQNMMLIQEGRAAAEKIIAESPDLKKYPLLRERIDQFQKSIHPE